MAIVQISKIQHRRGLKENLPNLGSAELAWALDTRQLYIGNGTLQEGAPSIGNTEILTQYSNFLAIEGAYTYKGLAAGYVVQTGPAGSPVSQTLQTWMDQWASVKDFGAVGDGVTDDSEAINRALYQLYCRDTNEEVRRALFFPAGVYYTSETIIIPPYARLVGEGSNSSVIKLHVSGDLSSQSAYCARTVDNAQQTGCNILSGAATIGPGYVEISSLGFAVDSTAVTDVFLVEDATFCTFTDSSFTGPLTDLTTASDDIAGVRFSSSAGLG